MTVFYAIPAEMNGPALIVMRLVLGTAMAAAIVVAFLAIRRGDVRTHSAWMTRAYAIGLGAGTQLLTLLPWTLAFGVPEPDDALGAHGRGMGDQPLRRRGRHPASRAAERRSPSRTAGRSARARVPTYHEGMTSPVRALWDAPPASPAPPRRVWRDWALVGVLAPLAVVEASVRPDVPWRWLWAVVLVALVPTLLWRRDAAPARCWRSRSSTGTVVGLATGARAAAVHDGVLPRAALRRVPLGLGPGDGARRHAGGRRTRAVLRARRADDRRRSSAASPSPSRRARSAWRSGGAPRARARELDHVRLREREQLARDLHDTVAHHVSAIAIQAQAGTAVAGDRSRMPPPRRCGPSKARRPARSHEMRAMVGVLRRAGEAELAPTSGARRRCAGSRSRPAPAPRSPCAWRATSRRCRRRSPPWCSGSRRRR